MMISSGFGRKPFWIIGHGEGVWSACLFYSPIIYGKYHSIVYVTFFHKNKNDTKQRPDLASIKTYLAMENFSSGR